MAAKKKSEAKENRFPKATEKDFQVIVKPLITEKTMALMQNENKVTVKVLVVVDEITENIFASARNVGYAKVVTTDNVSVLDLLNVDNLVISQASVKALEEALK